jgi:hypothetical protein
MSEKERSGIPAFLVDEGKKWISRALFAGFAVVILAAVTPFGFKFKAIWNSPENLQEVGRKLDAISDTLMRLTGDGRVTRQPDGMSYVREPVAVAAAILLSVSIIATPQRTGWRQDCNPYPPAYTPTLRTPA